MTKQGRNEPCACGSGKKYKRCCGNNKVVPIHREYLNEQLYEIEQDVFNYAHEHYQQVFDDFADDMVELDPVGNGERVSHIYTQALTPWIIFTYVLEDGKTMYDHYHTQYVSRIKNPLIKEKIDEWKNPVHSIFEVMTIDEKTNRITIQDLLTNAKYEIKQDSYEDIVLHDILIGSLQTYEAVSSLVFGAITLPTATKDFIMNIIDIEFNNDAEELHEDYPILMEIIISGPDTEKNERVANSEDELSWFRPEHEEVANELAHFMHERQISDEMIYTAIIFWNDYCHLFDPVVTKTSTYAAALDYYICQKYRLAEKLTQKELAVIYDTTASSISNHNRTFHHREEDMVQARQAKPSHFIGGGSLENEQMLKQMSKLLAEQTFESDDEIHAFMNQIMQNDTLNQMKTDDVDALFMEAINASGEKRIDLLEKVIAKDANHIDAYTLLAEETPSITTANALLEKALKIGRASLGEAYFQENDGEFWGLVETRPFMRAKAAYASSLAVEGRRAEAMSHLEELIRLNPRDNQGIRYDLITLYIEGEHYKEAENLMRIYKDERSAYMLFSKALIHYHLTQDPIETIDLFREANRSNPYVYDYIVIGKSVPKSLPTHYTPGEDSEAVLYAQKNMHLWNEVKDKIFSK